MLGEFLYGLTQKDAITQPVLQRRIEFTFASTAALLVSVQGPIVPQDKAFLVQHVTVSANAGAGQLTVDTSVSILDSVSGATVVAVIPPTPQTASRLSGQAMQVEFLLMPGERLQAAGDFNLAGVANGVGLHVIGIYLPKGNLQLR